MNEDILRNKVLSLTHHSQSSSLRKVSKFDNFERKFLMKKARALRQQKSKKSLRIKNLHKICKNIEAFIQEWTIFSNNYEQLRMNEIMNESRSQNSKRITIGANKIIIKTYFIGICLMD